MKMPTIPKTSSGHEMSLSLILEQFKGFNVLHPETDRQQEYQATLASLQTNV